jgi:membrane fusion protein, multidrug efflux system
MKTRVFLTLLVALAILGGIFGLWYYKGLKARAAGMAAQAQRPPPAVSTTVAEEQTWRSSLSAVGSLESRAGIVVRAEAEGQVMKIAFTSGARVVAGDLLVEIDTSVEREQLKGLEATAKLAELQLARARELRTAHTNSQAELDAAEASFAQATAAVGQLRATIAKKHIVAPFAGRLGITLVDPGQFLSKGDQVVALEAVDPIYVDFGLPQQHVGLVAPGMAVRVTADAFPGDEFTGVVEAVNPRIDDATRNVRIRATLPNPGEKLRPGMFARVTLDLPEVRKVIVLPTAAIVYNPYGNAVYVVSEQKTERGPMFIARQQFVELGATRGSQVSVLGGLNPGDQVVTSGQIKLRNGIPVQINNAVTPSADPAPRPPQS